MLQLIITNELEKRFGRELTPAEQTSALKYISDNTDEHIMLFNVEDALTDFVNEYYCVCDKCGEWVLRENTSEITGPYHSYRVCNNQTCEQEAYYDAHTDPYAELRTY